MGMLDIPVSQKHNCEKRVYSVDDLMEILDISRSSTYILIKKNLFRSFKIGKQLRISKASFDEWLDKGWPASSDAEI